MLCRGAEFRDEDIIINAVADAATDNTDREGECGNGGDEVLTEKECELGAVFSVLAPEDLHPGR